MKKTKKDDAGLFSFFLDKLENLLNKATSQKNPALWLYQNDARTPLFMLEGLSRLCTGVYKKHKFVKLDALFKLLEDILGAIDYYDVFAKEFTKNKKIPKTITSYLQAQTREKVQQLNETLLEKKWLDKENPYINKIRKKLSKVDWMKERVEVKAIYKFYVEAINTILNFVNREDFHFENVESDVHELRRKLRWLSIYPQSLQGSIQLIRSKKYPKSLDKYLTKEIVTSPFNKMPDAGNRKHFLLLDQNYFYALSWLIAELGKLKDNGLRVVVIKEALQQTTKISDAEAYKKTYHLTGTKQLTIPQVLSKSDAVCKTYFKEKDLEHILIGTSAAK
jgi:hypothetical protein